MRNYQIIFALILFWALFLGIGQLAVASHIRAGDLTAVRIPGSGLTYRFTVILYRDTGGVEPGVGLMFFDTGEDPIEVRPERIGFIDNETEIIRYQIDFTFPSAGTYSVSYLEPNRNAGVNNMFASEDTRFYIESTFRINPILGLNSSPVLTIPPIDRANVGQRFIHNPGAYDPDGDSLSYRLVVSKQGKDQSVQSYTYPDNPLWSNEQEDGSSPAIFEIDPITGDLTWDAPGVPGQYNVAFIVEEYRDGILIGEVNRDMQIIVLSSENIRPEVIVPQDTCVVAGSLIEGTIVGRDPDNDFVELGIAQDTSFIRGDDNLAILGGIFRLNPPRNSARFDLLNIQNTQGNGEERGIFKWQTSCFDVRKEPYQVTFKAKDRPPNIRNQLAHLQTWRITVVGPAPDTLAAEPTPGERSVTLNWNQYSCENAVRMSIWRRLGSYDFEPDACETGLPPYTGYQKIADVDIGDTTFVDDNAGQSLPPGSTYCYRIVAVFPTPTGGESYASMEACAFIPSIAPNITHVTVNETDPTDGAITVSWARPLEIDSVTYPPPYNYILARAEGADGDTDLEELPRLFEADDTTFTDTGLDTENLQYNYRLILLSDNNRVETSAIASSVRTTAVSGATSISLSWQANVPWNNISTRFPFHFIFRKGPGQDAFELIDSVAVVTSGLQYLDDGSHDGEELRSREKYCYFVSAIGTYDNPDLPDPLINLSQEACAIVSDTIPPCPPVLAIELLNCNSLEQQDLPCDVDCQELTKENNLSWALQPSDDCENDDVAAYNLYYSPTEGDPDTFELIATLPDTTFIHTNLESIAGCYVVTAIDESGNESAFSNVVCNDTCPYYRLPNAFTPNEGSDNFNDLFRPCKCYRDVESVEFTVYTRWGDKVYFSDDDVELNWDGKTTRGQRLSPGIYYYVANVTFFKLRPEERKKELKGVIHIIY